MHVVAVLAFSRSTGSFRARVRTVTSAGAAAGLEEHWRSIPLFSGRE